MNTIRPLPRTKSKRVVLAREIRMALRSYSSRSPQPRDMKSLVYAASKLDKLLAMTSANRFGLTLVDYRTTARYPLARNTTETLVLADNFEEDD